MFTDKENELINRTINDIVKPLELEDSCTELDKVIEDLVLDLKD